MRREDGEEPEQEPDEEPTANEKSASALTDPIRERLFKHRTLIISGAINQQLVSNVMGQLLAMASDSDEPINIFINSQGGHVESGDTIHDVIRFIKPRVRMIGTGWVASAGALIYVSVPVEDRFALPNTRFLLHQPAAARAARRRTSPSRRSRSWRCASDQPHFLGADRPVDREDRVRHAAQLLADGRGRQGVRARRPHREGRRRGDVAPLRGTGEAAGTRPPPPFPLGGALTRLARARHPLPQTAWERGTSQATRLVGGGGATAMLASLGGGRTGACVQPASAGFRPSSGRFQPPGWGRLRRDCRAAPDSSR
jgi:hypothetical protein